VHIAVLAWELDVKGIYFVSKQAGVFWPGDISHQSSAATPNSNRPYGAKLKNSRVMIPGFHPPWAVRHSQKRLRAVPLKGEGNFQRGAGSMDSKRAVIGFCTAKWQKKNTIDPITSGER